MNRSTSFFDAYKATHIIETLENYAISDRIDDLSVSSLTLPERTVQDEYDFWKMVLADNTKLFDVPFSLADFIISEWVPRVPGLIHSLMESTFSYKFDKFSYLNWDDHYPSSESGELLGGVGTNMLPPINGRRIVSVGKRGMVSYAIPLLIGDTIWHKLNLEPGHRIRLKRVRWQRMTQEWTQRFESIKGIPRAYLLVEDESQIEITAKREQPSYQPYTLIEYEREGLILYDYLIRDVPPEKSWDQIGDEFETRRVKHYSNGRFLLNPDPANPLFNDAYDSPEQLRRAEVGSRYHLELIKERIRDTYFRGKRAEEILQLLAQVYSDTPSINRIATYLRFPVTTFAGNRPADQISQFMNWCLNTPGKMEELIDLLFIDQQ
ncbi:hypothetical protein [Fibrella forsythiae]|uniref:Uncharacterized protein n=1 Tax=Fibrella forsythiae TaxID=2817061 RepID=A0ABS3JKT2_9BACT|nr:hypothetical protein [Fibrella forsythiae]MBO0950614.1 hypothetical protein [Fibrella forsythiae]